MQDTPKFEIQIPGYHSSVDDSKRAYTIPAAELPPITEEEHEVAKKLEISDEAYRRGKLAGVFGQQRLQAKAVNLGSHVEAMLSELGKGYRLLAVHWEESKLRWVLRIGAGEKVVTVSVPVELADDVIDSGALQDVNRLKNLVLFGVGREANLQALKMDLTGTLVHFWLSPGGREALQGVLHGGADFEALVVEEDSLGLWIRIFDPEPDSQVVTLLKWKYFAAARLEYQPEVPQERPPAGFKVPG